MTPDEREQFIDRIAREDYDPSWPRTGEVWEHYRGEKVVVEMVALDEATLEPVVVYRSHRNGYPWVRLLSVWLETVPWSDEQASPRFKRLEGVDA